MNKIIVKGLTNMFIINNRYLCVNYENFTEQVKIFA